MTVSLDGHTPDLYRAIRGVNGLHALAAGVGELRRLAPGIPIRARSTIHRRNFRFLPELIAKAGEIGVDQISFLAADVTSESFNRTRALPLADDDRANAPSLLLTAEETDEMAAIVESVISSHARELAERKVVPGPERLRGLVAYYRAHLGLGAFPRGRLQRPLDQRRHRGERRRPALLLPSRRREPARTIARRPSGRRHAAVQAAVERRVRCDVPALRLHVQVGPAFEALVKLRRAWFPAAARVAGVVFWTTSRRRPRNGTVRPRGIYPPFLS